MTYLDERYKTKVTKTALALLAIVTIFFVILSINEIRKGAYIGQPENIQNIIAVNGIGEATAIPDSARFTVGVTHEADTVETAQSQSTEAINEIIAYLEEAGVAEEDIKTLNYNISPRYEYYEAQISRPGGQRQLVGYQVSQMLEVTVASTEQAGELLSGVGSRGADTVSSLQFVVEDEELVQREAQVNAILDARKNARELANALGVSLDGVIGFQEVGGGSPYYRMEQAAFADVAGMGGGTSPQTPIGENRVESRVQVIYRIK
ncbi:MAG: SIMPL domain-containing protein [Candidatus Paceibacterota bacterium]